MRIPFLNEIINRRLANCRILGGFVGTLVQPNQFNKVAEVLSQPILDPIEAKIKTLSLGDLLTTTVSSFEDFFDWSDDPIHDCSTHVKIGISHNKESGLYKPESFEVGDIPEDKYKELWYLAREIRARKGPLQRVLRGGEIKNSFDPYDDKRYDGIELFNSLVGITNKGKTFDPIAVVNECTATYKDDIFNTNPQALNDYSLFCKCFKDQFQRVLTDSLTSIQRIANWQNPDKQSMYQELYDSAKGGTDQTRKANLSDYERLRKEQISRVVGQFLAPAKNLLALLNQIREKDSISNASN